MTAPHAWLLDHAARAPHAPAVAGPGFRASYGELAGRVLGVATLLRRAGLRPGERVLHALPAGGASVVASLGIQAAGGCSCEVSPRLGEAALASVVSQIGARIAFLHASDAALFGRHLGSETELVFAAGPRPLTASLFKATIEHLPEDGAVEPGGDPPLERPPDSPALVLFTSGSTGAPRGVVLSQRNLTANATSIAAYLELTARDRACLVLPLSYSYGRSVLQSHLLVGGSVFLDGRFMYPRLVLDTAAAEGCSGFSGVPATYEALRRVLDGPSRVPSFRYVTQAGGAMRRETVLWARQAFDPARLFLMYGQTEATARLAYLPPERIDDRPGSIGIAIPGVTLEVVGPDGLPLPDGQVGELCASGDNVAMGYLDAPAETAATFRNGRLHTGDLGHRDSMGFFYLVGRAREMLKVAGNRVSPLAIEEVLARHPDVGEVVVSGTPDPVQGEVPLAFVVMRAGASADEAALRRYCREQLPANMVPQKVTFLPALPRNEAGKVLRRELTEKADAQPVPKSAPLS